MKKSPNRLWITAIALGWLLDFLFWKKPGGINFAIFTILCLIGGFFILWADGHRPARGSLWLVPLILFFAAVTFVRAEPLTVLLGALFTLFLCALLTLTFLGGRWLEYSLADYLTGFLRLAGSIFARPRQFNTEARRARAQGGSKPKISPWPIVRGVIIALPVLAVFASLLSSADAIFDRQLADFIRLFNLENLPEYIFRLTYIMISAYLLAAVFLHAGSQSRDERLAGEDKPSSAAFLGIVESAIVLGSVALLFAAFVLTQFRYFFGGQANIHIEGFTYSEYARRGFSELVLVAFFSLLLILGLSAITRRDQAAQRRVFSGLAIGIVGLVLVMLVSAYQRLALYEAAYGFSRLRTYTHVFLVWIALLLIAVVALEFLQRERAFAAAALLASLGFAASLSLLNVDAFIVRQNIYHEIVTQGGTGRELDADYFLELSDDAIPAIAQGYRSSAVSPSLHEQLGAALTCLQASRSTDEFPWQSLHLARFRADRVLESLEASLGEYDFADHQVTGPSGKVYLCN